MARGRRAANYFGRTKGHSVLPQRNYGLLNRSRYYLDDDYQVPGTYRPSTSFYHGSDYYVADAMTTHATNLSTDAVYDNMDLAARSRGKDQRLMSQVNAALAYASPSTPARARASRRANRQQQPQSVTPQSTSSYVYSVPPQEDAYVPYVNRDRYDRFNLRSRANADRVYSSGSIASKAGPRPSSAKAYRDSEGYSKPKNLLSWQGRKAIYT